jgi:hypothetical protein
MSQKIFVRLDADKIGDAIELSLINGDINNAKLIHKKVQSGISHIEQHIIQTEHCVVLMKGCDDILFKIQAEYFSNSLLIELKEKFLKLTSYTISIGVAYSLEETLLNLRKAKLKGRNVIVSNIE